jgi:L-iditol 2-dehydrogenase
MLAAVFNGPNSLNISDFNLQDPGSDDVIVKVDACGICGTDFHIYRGEAPSKPPVIIGHEYAGVITEIGKHVKYLNVGNKVAINPNIHCGYCEFCKKGKINLCPNLRALGVTINGGLAQYSVVPSTQVYPVPNDFPTYYAAFAEPLSCCIHGINLADIKLGDYVAILGAGTIGLLMLQLASLKGASKIIVIEPNEEKRNIAKKLHADCALNPNSADFQDEFSLLTNNGADVVIECVGNPRAVETAFRLTKRGGTLVIFGLSPSDSSIIINLQSFFHKELNIKSSLLNPFTFQYAVDLLISGKVKVDSFMLNRCSLNELELNKLFTIPGNNQSFIKNMVFPNN